MSELAEDNLKALEQALLEFFSAYRRSRARLQRDPGLVGLTNAQFAVLEAARRNGDAGIGAIAEAADVAQPPATRAIQRLERQGLVVRRRADSDGRVTTVAVTEKGERLLGRHRLRLRDAALAINAATPTRDRKRVRELLRLLAGTLDELA